ncbi:MAG TPA: hypothetical protein VH856_11475, partial [Steroidobacteraceae bacterium]
MQPRFWQPVAAVAMAVCAAAAARGSDLPEADATCLGCHSMEALARELPNGETLSLHVPPDVFARSVHAPFGCAGCHAHIDPAVHPGQASEIESLRQYSVLRAEACRMCHADAAEQHDGSLHAARVRE